MQKITSSASENFVKLIYRYEQSRGSTTKPGAIAKELGITNAAASEMARKLAGRNLIHYKKYQGMLLTEEGRKMALNILRKHRLWETFLYQTFNFSLHEIHREAELLEHQTSDFLMEHLSMYLGNPQIDPHGDPIPGNDGKISLNKEHIQLSMTSVGNTYEVTRLNSSDKEFFDFCLSNKITIGSSLTVIKQYTQNKMTEIEINNKRLLLNADIANLIYVKK